MYTIQCAFFWEIKSWPLNDSCHSQWLGLARWLQSWDATEYQLCSFWPFLGTRIFCSWERYWLQPLYNCFLVVLRAKLFSLLRDYLCVNIRYRFWDIDFRKLWFYFFLNHLCSKTQPGNSLRGWWKAESVLPSPKLSYCNISEKLTQRFFSRFRTLFSPVFRFLRVVFCSWWGSL